MYLLRSILKIGNSGDKRIFQVWWHQKGWRFGGSGLKGREKKKRKKIEFIKTQMLTNVDSRRNKISNVKIKIINNEINSSGN